MYLTVVQHGLCILLVVNQARTATDTWKLEGPARSPELNTFYRLEYRRADGILYFPLPMAVCAKKVTILECTRGVLEKGM